MNKTFLTEEELQHIEHCNKVLKEHAELVRLTIESTTELFNNYVPTLNGYVKAVATVKHEFGEQVTSIIQSSRQLKIATGNVQEIISFMSAVIKLNEILTPELVEKLRRLSKD